MRINFLSIQRKFLFYSTACFCIPLLIEIVFAYFYLHREHVNTQYLMQQNTLSYCNQVLTNNIFYSKVSELSNLSVIRNELYRVYRIVDMSLHETDNSVSSDTNTNNLGEQLGHRDPIKVPPTYYPHQNQGLPALDSSTPLGRLHDTLSQSESDEALSHWFQSSNTPQSSDNFLLPSLQAQLPPGKSEELLRHLLQIQHLGFIAFSLNTSSPHFDIFIDAQQRNLLDLLQTEGRSLREVIFTDKTPVDGYFVILQERTSATNNAENSSSSSSSTSSNSNSSAASEQSISSATPQQQLHNKPQLQLQLHNQPPSSAHYPVSAADVVQPVPDELKIAGFDQQELPDVALRLAGHQITLSDSEQTSQADNVMWSLRPAVQITFTDESAGSAQALGQHIALFKEANATDASSIGDDLALMDGGITSVTPDARNANDSAPRHDSSDAATHNQEQNQGEVRSLVEQQLSERAAEKRHNSGLTTTQPPLSLAPETAADAYADELRRNESAQLPWHTPYERMSTEILRQSSPTGAEQLRSLRENNVVAPHSYLGIVAPLHFAPQQVVVILTDISKLNHQDQILKTLIANSLNDLVLSVGVTSPLSITLIDENLKPLAGDLSEAEVSRLITPSLLRTTAANGIFQGYNKRWGHYLTVGYFKPYNWFILINSDNVRANSALWQYMLILFTSGFIMAVICVHFMGAVAERDAKELRTITNKLKHMATLVQDPVLLKRVCDGLPRRSDEIGQLASHVRLMAKTVYHSTQEALRRQNISTTTATAEYVNVIKHLQQTPRTREIFFKEYYKNRFCVHTAMAETTTGDFYDVLDLPENKIAIFVGSINERGLDAVNISNVNIGILRQLVRLTQSLKLPLSTMIYEFNQNIVENNPKHTLTSLCVVIIDQNTGKFEYLNAGHTLPLLYHKNNGFEYIDVRTGPVLGRSNEQTFSSLNLQLQDKDSLIFYTDGLLDCTSRRKEPLGQDGFESMLHDEPFNSATETINNLVQKIERYSKGSKLVKDYTIACYQYYADPKEAKSQPQLETDSDPTAADLEGELSAQDEAIGEEDSPLYRQAAEQDEGITSTSTNTRPSTSTSKAE